MKKNLSLVAVMVFLTLSACQKQALKSQVDSIDAMTMAKRDGPSASTIYLNVTVDDLSGISSDGGGIYTHGLNKVEAQILSSDGNFYMQTNNSTREPVRSLNFPFNSERLEGRWNYRLRTTCSEWLQNMDDGEVQVMRFRVWGNLQRGVLDWNMVFDNGLDAQTDYVNVTRLSRTAWTIEPYSNAIAKLTDGSGAPIGNGYHAVPFKLTLTKR